MITYEIRIRGMIDMEFQSGKLLGPSYALFVISFLTLGLPIRDRELLILRIGYLNQGAYE